MAFRVSGHIQMDAAQAKAELGQTKKAVDDVKRGSGQLGAAGREGARGMQSLARGADAAERELRGLSAAEQQAARNMTALGQTSSTAAGSMGNLVAQFNDIGIMLAAGQNPLQLAIQQGTQITQVIGPMGAAGAARALGSAFLSMLSPINLITIGGIAAGAAIFGWLTRAGDEAADFEDALSGLADAIERYNDAVEAANVDTEELKRKFGAAAEEARDLLRTMLESERRDVQIKLRASIEAVIDETSLELPRFDLGDQQRMARMFDVSLFGFDARARREAQQTVNAVLRGYSDLALAADGSVSQQVAALERLIASFRAAAEASGDVSAEENAELQKLEQTLLRLYELRGSIDREELANGEQLKALGADLLASAQGYLDTRIAAVTSARQLLADLEHEAQLQALVARYGEDSLQVAEFRVQAERAALDEQLEALPVAESLKEEIRQAFENAQALALTNMAGTIGAAANEAARLAGNLAAARGAAIDRATGNNPDFFDPRNESGMAGRITRERPVPPQNRPGYVPPRVSSRGGGGGGRGRASEIDRERQAVERLLAREREALEVLRETDPVKKEMLRNREALKAATDAERQALEDLIRQREAEKKALEEAERAQEFWRESIYEGLEGAILRGEELTDVLGSVAQALLRAALMGDGPLGGIFGGQGLIGMLFPGLGKFAGGGFITGKGGEREDRELIMASPGEFMVNAAATRRHRHLLEHLNAGGDMRGFAGGGAIGGGAAPAAPRTGGGNDLLGTIRVALGPGLQAQMEGTAQRVAVEVVRSYDREVAPRTIAAHGRDPRRIG